MANELHVRLSVSAEKGYFDFSWPQGQLDVDLAAGRRSGYVQTIGFAADEVIAVGDAGTYGWLFLKNLDTTNYVSYGPDSGGSMVAFGKLKPGEFAAMRIVPGITVRAQADTGECSLEVNLLDD